MHEAYFLNVSIFEDDVLFKKGMEMISAVRAEKIKQFKNPSTARLSLGAGVLLSFVLEKYGLNDRMNKITIGEHGKPLMVNSNFHFSLSHSGEYALCATSEVPIGADLQKLKDKIPENRKRILSEEEENYLKNLSEIERIKFFYRLWTMKESLIKWDGRGLRLPLSEFSFIKDGKLQNKLYFEGKPLYFQEYQMLSDYGICICAENGEFPEKIHEITSEILTKY